MTRVVPAKTFTVLGKIDVRAQTKHGESALALAKDLVAARTGLAATRSAWARAALQAGDMETATRQAGVPVERGGATGDSIITLAAVLSAGGTKLAPLPRWENMLERDPTTANRGLGAAVFFVFFVFLASAFLARADALLIAPSSSLSKI